MSQYQNREGKKYVILMLAAAFTAALCMGIFTWQMCRRMRAEENAAVYALLQEIQEEYPQADVNALAEVLNDTSARDVDDAAQFRAEYGLTDDFWALGGMQSLEKEMIIAHALILAAAELVIVLLFLAYMRKRKRGLDELTGYMEHIVMGHYDLELSDNSEDELSNLKNQLYKITVYLREQADREKNSRKVLAESVSDISHQLKTPLTSATILLDNLNDHPDMDPATRKKFLAEITRQISSMKWMIVSMLKLSRLDAGVIEFEREVFSVDQMIAESVEYLEVLAELKGLRVEVTGDSGGKLIGDRHWNREAFSNLLKNAIEHSPSGETVTVRVEQNSVYTAIGVTNVGEPISREMEQKIFRRYYSDARASDENAGIGLPLAKAIVERQNGYLTVDSGDGKNTFTIKYLR